MDGKAQQLGAKRLFNMLGIPFIELVLFRKPPMGPFGGRIFTADRVQFAKHFIAQMGRCCDVQANGGEHFRAGIVIVGCRLFRPRQRSPRRKVGRLAIQPAADWPAVMS